MSQKFRIGDEVTVTPPFVSTSFPKGKRWRVESNAGAWFMGLYYSDGYTVSNYETEVVQEALGPWLSPWKESTPVVTVCNCDLATVLMVTGCRCEAGRAELAKERKK